MTICYILFFVFLFYAINSCNKSSGQDNPLTISPVTNDIDTPTIWNNSKVYLIQKKEFTIHSKLTIQAGTTIKFDAVTGPGLIVVDTGSITAQGTLSRPVVFTSINDDKYGGDSNNDNGVKKPQAGDWEGITINSKTTSYFHLCIFSYGGKGSSPYTLRLEGQSNAEVTYSVFANNTGGNLEDSCGALNALNSGTNTVVYSNKFYGNNLPLSINSSTSIDSTNLFYNPDNVNETNKINAILVNTNLPISKNVMWLETKVAFLIRGPIFEIGKGQLLLGNNVVLKMYKDTYMKIDKGDLSLLNHDGPGVVFTSIYDDSYKGDSNGDGNAIQAKKGDWYGISDLTSSDPYVKWSNVLYTQ